MKTYHSLIHWSNPLRPQPSLGSNWILYLLVFHINYTQNKKGLCKYIFARYISKSRADMAKTGHQLKTNSHCLGHKTNKEQTFFKYTLYETPHKHTLKRSVHRHTYTHTLQIQVCQGGKKKKTKQTNIQI